MPIKTQIPIISEEKTQIDFSEWKEWSLCWIVDPIDGTKEFIKRNGEFTVNIALVKNGIPILGVIYIPTTKTVYFTPEEVSSSYKMVLNNEAICIDEIINNAIEIRPNTESISAVKIVSSRSHLNTNTKKIILEIKNNKPVELVSKGSSL